MENWYLYTLSNKDVIFYVGITQKPVVRFIQHSCSSLGGSNFEYIYWAIEQGDWASIRINIITHYGKKDDAKIGEAALIRYLVSINNKLTNLDHNPPRNRLITCRPQARFSNRKKILPHIKGVVDDYHRRIFKEHTIDNRFNASLYANRGN